MPPVTLATLKRRARVHADQEDSTFVTDEALVDFLNISLAALYDKLVVLWEDYKIIRDEVLVNGETFVFGDDFFKLLSFRVQTMDGKFRQLKRCGASDEDYLLNASGLRPEEHRYRLEGDRTIRFVPAYASDTVVKLSYIPLRGPLVDDADSEDWPQGWEEWAVVDVAIKMVSKAEQSTTALEKLQAKAERHLEESAPQRDENDVARVQDVTTGTDGCSDRDF